VSLWLCFLYGGPCIHAAYQVSVHFCETFQRRRLRKRSIRNKNCLRRECLLTDWNKLSKVAAVNTSVFVIYRRRKFVFAIRLGSIQTSDFRLRTSHFEVQTSDSGIVILRRDTSCMQDRMVLQSYNSSYMNLNLRLNQCPWSMTCGSKVLTFVRKLTLSLHEGLDRLYDCRTILSCIHDVYICIWASRSVSPKNRSLWPTFHPWMT
jgi:hypothetical protein